MHNSKAFTLIELLIVVAIIGILAAIAVPNFLNAQIRAKVSRSMAELRMVDDQNLIRKNDTGLWMIDGNDDSEGEKCKFPRGKKFWGVKPSDVEVPTSIPDDNFSGQIYEQLTTPVAYMTGPLVDPFGKGIFYGYDDLRCSNGSGTVYFLMAAGPDGDVAEYWNAGRAVPYLSSNGLNSNGDIVRCRILKGKGHDFVARLGYNLCTR